MKFICLKGHQWEVSAAQFQAGDKTVVACPLCGSAPSTLDKHKPAWRLVMWPVLAVGMVFGAASATTVGAIRIHEGNDPQPLLMKSAFEDFITLTVLNAIFGVVAATLIGVLRLWEIKRAPKSGRFLRYSGGIFLAGAISTLPMGTILGNLWLGFFAGIAVGFLALISVAKRGETRTLSWKE